MSADDLRTRAWEAADKAADLHLGALPVSAAERWHRIGYVSGYAAGYLAHAAQQPSREVYSVQYWEDGDGIHGGWVTGNGYFTYSRSDAEEQLEYDRRRHSTVLFRLAVAEITDWRDVPTNGADR